MPFAVLPAIDVADGRLAVWTPAGPEPLDAFGGDPLAAAAAHRAAGATWAHVVDMDHAMRGSPFAADLVEGVVAEGLSVQASGGIADAATVNAALAAGARRVVLGSSILADEPLTAAVMTSVPDGALLVGLECRDGEIVARGEREVTLELAGTLAWLAAAGAPGFLVTAVTRVGTMTGPDLATIGRVLRAGRPVLAAGGIASIEDLGAVRAAGAAGAVVGRASLDGTLNLPQVFAWVGTHG